MPVPVWEANDSFSKFDQDTEGRIDICALPAALTEFYTAFHIPQPARLANTVVHNAHIAIVPSAPAAVTAA